MPSFAATRHLPTTRPTPTRRLPNRSRCSSRGVETAAPSTEGKPLVYDFYPAIREAVVVDNKSPFRGARVGETPTLAPQSGEVVIEVHAAGVNACDWFCTDLFATMPPFFRQSPFVAGKDVSGVVAAVGPNVTDWIVGDEIFGLTGYAIQNGLDGMTPGEMASGSFATYTTMKASNCVLKPPNVSFIDAAGVPLAGMTAWQALIDKGGLTAGSKVLILGGAGGVGTLAIQIAKVVCKCDTVAVTCSPSSAALVKALGADIVIDHTTKFFEQVLDGARYDCVIDCVGYDDKCRRASKVLRRSGVLIDITGPPSLGHLRAGQKMDSVFDYYQGIAGDGKRVGYELMAVEDDTEVLRMISSFVGNGEIMPVTDKVFDGLDSFQEAFDLNKSGGAHGKLIINIKESMEIEEEEYE